MAFHEVQWYDRKPISYAGDDEQINLGPHATATRLEYTCPRDRMALVELLQCQIERMVVDTAPGYPISSWYFTPYGEAEFRILCARILKTNLVGDKDQHNIAGTIVMCPGDRIRARTADNGTDGRCYYYESYKLTEFDAYLYHAPPKTRPEPLVDVQSAKPRPDPVM